MLKFLPALVAACTLLLGGLVQGWAVGRWGHSEALATAVARLDRVPNVIGDWQGQPPQVLDPRELAIARLAGYVARPYVNQQTHQSVRILLACGRPGPLSVHTPDICFQGAGYVPLTAPTRYAARSGEPDEPTFWFTKFGKEGQPASASLCVYWAWSTDGKWQASANPRWQFGGATVLYKLYVIEDLSGHYGSAENEACREFIPQLINALQDSLFSNP